jgi:hypothetical protein
MDLIHIHWQRDISQKTLIKFNFSIAYTTHYIISTIVKVNNQQHKKFKFEHSSVYQRTFADCGLKYIGQTCCKFHTRFNDHMLSFRNNNNNSTFPQLLLDSGHAIGPIFIIKQILHTYN